MQPVHVAFGSVMVVLWMVPSTLQDSDVALPAGATPPPKYEVSFQRWMSVWLALYSSKEKPPWCA